MDAISDLDADRWAKERWVAEGDGREPKSCAERDDARPRRAATDRDGMERNMVGYRINWGRDEVCVGPGSAAVRVEAAQVE